MFNFSLRSSAVDFINTLINKYELPQEKLTQVTHPSGKKFMGLLLEIINIATKEVMMKKIKNIEVETCLDINTAKLVSEKMYQKELDLQLTFNEDATLIKERTLIIQQLLLDIQNQDDDLINIELEDFIECWYSYVMERSESIKTGNSKIDEIMIKTQIIFENAQTMLRTQSLNLTVEKDQEATIPKLIQNLNAYIPIIKQILQNSPVTESKVSEGEKNMIMKQVSELQQLENIIPKTSEKRKCLKDLCLKLCTVNETCRLLEDESPLEQTEYVNQSNFKLFLEPPYAFFDASKNCVAYVDIKDSTHLSLLNDKFFIDLKDKSQALKKNDLNITGVFKIPHNQTILSQRRQRRNAMEVLDKAISSKSLLMDQSILEKSVACNVAEKSHHLLPSSTPFSSTMQSPEMHRNIFGLNLSTISEISMKTSPKQIYSKKNALKRPSNINHIAIPITYTDATLREEDLERTLCNKENFGAEIDTEQKLVDEDLLDISDSCLTTEY